MANIVRRGESEGGVARRQPQFQVSDPFRAIGDLFRFPFEDLERGIGIRPVFVPDVDLRETQDAYMLESDLPGFKQDEVEITITGDRLTISGRREPPKEESRQYLLRERPAGEFVRTFVMPTGTDPEGVRADFKDGVLLVTIPKRPEIKARKIPLGKGGEKASAGGTAQAQGQGQGQAQGQPQSAPPRS
jgi:HSP20 family protein